MSHPTRDRALAAVAIMHFNSLESLSGEFQSDISDVSIGVVGQLPGLSGPVFHISLHNPFSGPDSLSVLHFLFCLLFFSLEKLVFFVSRILTAPSRELYRLITMYLGIVFIRATPDDARRWPTRKGACPPPVR